MIFYWDIFVNGQYMTTLPSISRSGAIQSYYNSSVGCSRYSGVSYSSIEAKRKL